MPHVPAPDDTSGFPASPAPGAAAPDGAHAHAASAAQLFEAAVPDDPLFPYQWHLKNTGQHVFGDTRPQAGVDLNLGTLHQQGITGKGVVVAIHEPGRIDPDHEDLAPNLLARHPLDRATAGDFDVAHATATAGIIAAVEGNGKGGGSIAPGAQLIDMAAPGAGDLPRARLHNLSGGSSPVLFTPYSAAEYPDQDVDGGSGDLFIKSGGNEFESAEKIGVSAQACSAATGGTGTSCLTAAAESMNAMARVVTVASVNAAGVKASYSSSGSTLWVSGLGGEYGHERQYVTDSGAVGLPNVADAHLYAPAIVTTDMSGADRGLNRDRPGSPRYNALDGGSLSSVDASGDYTARANGTSAAAPTVTGVTALMLQANPALTWRDIKYILATTARQIDPDRQKIVWQGLVLDDGWVTNAAGRAFSNWYGYGLVDATAAVQAAQRHTPLGPLRNTGWLATADKEAPVAAREAAASGPRITVDDDMKIETVQLRLRTTHKNPNQLHIVLTSPSGTSSIILPAHTLVALPDGAFSIDLTASNAFLDESARGTWTLRVVDAKDPAPTSAVVSWELRVLGH
ncbi:hypothetical protein AKI39_04405 [Bordetella sp. H567]|nr:hypothetical protein AKI39_04405 [Bordetella sp. H567]